jgi:nitrite reductase/ring-hydroxylating ferredoxin subunit/Fe-S cluster biogenesis protein NfuA
MTQTPHNDNTPTPPADDLEALAERVDQATSEVHALDDDSRTRALNLKHAVEAFHKAGLTRIVRRLRDDPRGKELLFELVDDPLIYALFVMHGIIRADPVTRVTQVLETVRPYLHSHGGDVELVEVRGDTVSIRLHGACNGCSQSAAALRQGVEEAILGQIAEIKQVEVVPSEPSPALIAPDAIGVSPGPGWVKGPSVEEMPSGTLLRFDTNVASVLIVNFDNRLSAFRNTCVHKGLPLDGGLFDVEAGILTCPWHGFCYDAHTGECITAPQAQLESFPIRVTGGQIWMRPTKQQS